MPKIVGRNERGFVDPLSLFGLLFLVVTLAAVTFVTTNKNISLNIQEKAAKLGKTGNSAFDKCREESGREVCNERLGINVNWKGEIVNEIDTSNVDKDAPQGQPTCDANGVQYSPGAVVMYGGIGSNATCGSDGKWDVGVGATTDIKPENVPEYAKEAVEKEKAIEAEKQLTEPVAVPTTVTVEPEQIGLTQSTNQTSGTTVVQQPAVTTITTTTQVGQPCTNCHLTPTQQTQNSVQLPSQQTVAQVINLMNKDNPVPPTTHYAVIDNKLVTGTVETNKPAPQVLPDNNYGSCNGDPTCNSALTSIDRGMNAISFGGWSNYTEAYAPDKVKYTWQESGYKSVKECQDDMIAKNNNAQAAASCNTYQITKEQAISSIKLGTTLTAEAAAIIALPGAIGAGSTAIEAVAVANAAAIASGGTAIGTGATALSVLAPALTTFGAVSTLLQTSAAAVAQITDPGSPEAWKQTGYAALSWLNIGTADKLIKSFGALDAAKKAGQATETLVTAAQSARNLNNVVSGINLAVDVPNAVSTCSQAGFFTGSCGGALAAVGADIVFGTVDYKQGQLGFGNPLTKVNEGALIGPLPDIKDPNGTRIATPAEIDQINQLIANPFGTTPSISNVDGEVKFTPSRQLDMFDQLARDPVANTSTVVNNGTELIFPDKPARQDPNTNFNLTKSDPNEVAAIAAFNSTDINTQGGTVAQLTPSNLNSQIPNTPITDVTAPKPVEPNADINAPKPLRERLFGEPKTKKFSNVKTGETILIKPGDTIRTGNFETKMPKPDDYPDGIFWTKNPGDTPQRLTGEGVPITKGNSAENINFADKDGGRIVVDVVEHTTDANGRPITKPTASTAITLTDELNVQTTITRAASETGLLTLRGPDGEWFPGLKKLFGNGKPAAPTSNEAVIDPSEKLVDPETSANNSGATNNEKTVSTAEELFDHFKKEYKSELPENLVVHKDPNDFYSFQQELIDAAKNGEITDEFLAQKMRDLQGRGNVTFVIKDPGEINDISGGIAYTQKVLNPKTGKYEITVFLPSPANLAEYKNIDIEPARIKIAELIGHEAGHAYDEVGLSAIGVNPNSSGGLWATEYLQQNFSNEFQKALGVENPVKDGFVKGVEAQANIIKNTSGEPLPATKQPSALAAWWDDTAVKPLGDLVFGKKPIFLDNLDTPLPPTVGGNTPVVIKPVETQAVEIPYSKELDPLIEVKNAWNKYGDRITTAYNNKDAQGLIDIAKENGYQVKIVPFGEKVDIVEIGGKIGETTKMPITKKDTVRIGKDGGKKTLFIATSDISNPTFKIDELAHDIGAVITDVKFIPIEKIFISPYSFADFMTKATGEKWNASDIAKNFGTLLNNRTKSVEVPITRIVDALTFGEVPGNFLESVPVKITIPQKFTNWWDNIINPKVNTTSGLIPTKGTIEISKLHPHEFGYNPRTVDELTSVLEKSRALDPVKITEYNGQFYTYDGANRVTAYVQSGQDQVPYIFTEFNSLSNLDRLVVETASTGSYRIYKIPERYGTDFPISPVQSTHDTDFVTESWFQRNIYSPTDGALPTVTNWAKAEMAKTNPDAFKNIGQDITTNLKQSSFLTKVQTGIKDSFNSVIDYPQYLTDRSEILKRLSENLTPEDYRNNKPFIEELIKAGERSQVTAPNEIEIIINSLDQHPENSQVILTYLQKLDKVNLVGSSALPHVLTPSLLDRPPADLAKKLDSYIETTQTVLTYNPKFKKANLINFDSNLLTTELLDKLSDLSPADLAKKLDSYIETATTLSPLRDDPNFNDPFFFNGIVISASDHFESAQILKILINSLPKLKDANLNTLFLYYDTWKSPTDLIKSLNDSFKTATILAPLKDKPYFSDLVRSQQNLYATWARSNPQIYRDKYLDILPTWLKDQSTNLNDIQYFLDSINKAPPDLGPKLIDIYVPTLLKNGGNIKSVTQFTNLLQTKPEASKIAEILDLMPSKQWVPFIKNYEIYNSQISIPDRFNIIMSTSGNERRIAVNNFVTELQRIDADYKSTIAQLLDGVNPTSVDKYVYIDNYLKSIDENYAKSYEDLAEKFGISDWQSKTHAQVLAEITPQIPTIPLKPAKVTFNFKMQDTLYSAPENLMSTLRTGLEPTQGATSEDISTAIKTISDQYSKISDTTLNGLVKNGINSPEKNQLMSIIPEANRATAGAKIDGILKSNLPQDMKLQNIRNVVLASMQTVDNEVSLVIRELFIKTDAQTLLDGFVKGTLSPEDTSIFLNHLSELQTNALPDLIQEYPGLSGFDKTLESTDLWKNIKQINAQKVVAEQVAKSNVKEITLSLTNKNLIDVWQGNVSGTCFGSCPAFLSQRPNIIPVKMLKDDDIFGNALFIIQPDKFILVGFDPSVSFASAVTKEKMDQFVDLSMQGLQKIADENGLKLMIGIPDEVGGLSNRANIEEYILQKYLPGSKKVPIQQESTLQPVYDYEPKNAYQLDPKVTSDLRNPVPTTLSQPKTTIFGYEFNGFKNSDGNFTLWPLEKATAPTSPLESINLSTKEVTNLVNSTKGPIIEVGGPTPGGYKQVYIPELNRRIFVSNIETGTPVIHEGVQIGQTVEGHVDLLTDSTKLPFADSSVGTILGSALEEQTIPQTLSEAHRVLEPDGILVLQYARSSGIEIINQAEKLGFKVISDTELYKFPDKPNEVLRDLALQKIGESNLKVSIPKSNPSLFGFEFNGFKNIGGFVGLTGVGFVYDKVAEYFGYDLINDQTFTNMLNEFVGFFETNSKPNTIDAINPNQTNPDTQKPANSQQQATIPKVNPAIQSSQDTSEQQRLELERQEKIKSGLYAQIDADLATQTILGGAGKPFKNIGCGQVAVANILCEYGNYCPTPIQIANQIPLEDYGTTGLTSSQSNIKILNENGFTTDPYTKSLQYHLTEYMEPTDVLWISGIVGGINHHTYIDGYTLDKNGVAIFNLNDSYFGDGYKCKTSGDSSFSCDNPDGSHINIGAENANIYIIDTNI